MEREPTREAGGRTGHASRAALLTCGLVTLLAAPRLQAQEAGHGGVSAAELAKANNPLADANAINLQNYFMPSLQALPDASVNLFLHPALRPRR